MWMMHFLHHLKDGGTAGFVMAMGELSNGELARLEVRNALVDLNFVDCIVRLSGQLFAQTQIPCALWLLSKNRDGKGGHRNRKGEVLFIDGGKLGALIPGSRKQKQLAPEEIERIAAAYREFKWKGRPADEPGFCRVATLEEIREHRYVLTPGRYVGSANGEDDDTPFEERFPKLVEELQAQFDESNRLEREIRAHLARVAVTLTNGKG
jgi:type I restriction enzyme M protein